MGQIYRKIDILVKINYCMMKSTLLRIKPDLLFPLFISLLITLYIFYIDEGKYNFNGILEFANLFFLGVYALMFFGFQKLIQTGLRSLGLTRNMSILLQSIASGIVLFALLFMFFIIIS